MTCYFFFFSSRRRHTRLQGDWSSDVCSSDLHHDGVKTDRYAVRGHRVVHLSIELLRLHVDIDTFSRDSCERSSRLDRIGIDSAMAKNPWLLDQYDFMPGIRRIHTAPYQPQRTQHY